MYGYVTYEQANTAYTARTKAVRIQHITFLNFVCEWKFACESASGVGALSLSNIHESAFEYSNEFSPAIVHNKDGHLLVQVLSTDWTEYM